MRLPRRAWASGGLRRNPAEHDDLDRRMSRAGFERMGMGGNTSAHVKGDPERWGVEVVVVSSLAEGQAADSPGEPVTVYFTGSEHSEPLLVLGFPSAARFLDCVEAADGAR